MSVSHFSFGMTAWKSRLMMFSGAPEFDTKWRKLLIYMEPDLKLPLQKGQLRILRGLFDVQRLEHFGLIGADGRDAGDRLGLVDPHLVTLNPTQLSERLFRREFAFGQSQPLPHDAVDDQRQEAYKRVSADSFRQPVVHRRDFNLGLHLILPIN